MREALQIMSRPEGMRRVHHAGPGKPPWPAHPNTIRALTRHGLATHSQAINRRGLTVDIWRITPAGQQTLDPPPIVRPDTPQLLNVPGGSTRLHLAGDTWLDVRIPEPEPMNAPPDRWVRRGRVLHADAQDRRERAKRAKAA